MWVDGDISCLAVDVSCDVGWMGSHGPRQGGGKTGIVCCCCGL